MGVKLPSRRIVPDTGDHAETEVQAQAWAKETKGHTLLRDVLVGLKEEIAELRVLLRDETLTGIENSLDELANAVVENTEMLGRVKSAIMQVPDWGRERS